MNALMLIGIVGFLALIAAAVAGALVRRGVPYRLHVTLAIIALLIGVIHAFLAYRGYW